MMQQYICKARQVVQRFYVAMMKKQQPDSDAQVTLEITKLMAKVTNTCDNQSNVVLICGSNHFFVTQATSRMDHTARPSSDDRI